MLIDLEHLPWGCCLWEHILSIAVIQPRKFILSNFKKVTFGIYAGRFALHKFFCGHGDVETPHINVPQYLQTVSFEKQPIATSF
jgi:hypothetical protein